MKFPKGESFTNTNQYHGHSMPPIVQDQENIPSFHHKNLPREVQNDQSFEAKSKMVGPYKSSEECMRAISPYKKEIVSYLVSLPKFAPFPMCNYFSEQKDITESMRIMLLNWLVDVHLKYKLMAETLFITVNIIDQYLSVRRVQRSELQLLGITALWIAAKYEETYQVPKVSNLVYICDSAYSVRQILAMEGSILTACEFNLLQPTSLNYFDLLNVEVQLDQSSYCLAMYFMEIALFQIDLRRYTPSTVAISTLYFMGKLINSKEMKSSGIQLSSISKVMREIAIDQDEIKSCARQICLLWQKTCSGNSTSLKLKYASKAYLAVSKIAINEFTHENYKGIGKGMEVEPNCS